MPLSIAAKKTKRRELWEGTPLKPYHVNHAVSAQKLEFSSKYAVKPALPSNESKTGSDRTLTMVLWAHWKMGDTQSRRKQTSTPRVGPRVDPRLCPREPHKRAHDSTHEVWFCLFSALQGLPTKSPTKRPTKASPEVPMKVYWETRGQFRKRVVLANVPSFWFSFRGNMLTYPCSGFRSGGTSECAPRSGFHFGGTSAKTTLLENHPFVNPRKVFTQVVEVHLSC